MERYELKWHHWDKIRPYQGWGQRTLMLSVISGGIIGVPAGATWIYNNLPEPAYVIDSVLKSQADDLWGSLVVYGDGRKNEPRNWIVGQHSVANVALVREFVVEGREDWVGQISSGSLITGGREHLGPWYGVREPEKQEDYEVMIKGQKYGLWIRLPDNSGVYRRHGRASVPVIGSEPLYIRLVDLNLKADEKSVQAQQ